MLQTDDLGVLFASLQAVYGHKWAHQADAIPIWQNALRRYSAKEVMRAANATVLQYADYPPTLGQFLRLLDESAPRLPSADGENSAQAESIYTYTRPQTIRNPRGNPHGITLPESIAARRQGESAVRYEKRIADEVIFAIYPKMRTKDHINTPI